MKRLTTSEKLLIKRLHQHGYTIASIAIDFEITEAEVKRIIQEDKKDDT